MGSVTAMDEVTLALLGGGDARYLDQHLKTANPDSYSVLLSPSVRPALIDQLGGNDAAEWILDPMTWDVSSYGPAATLSTGQTLLHLLWQDLSSQLTLKLDKAFQVIPLPSKGVVLCFYGDAELSLLVGYSRSPGGSLSLRPVAALEHPLAIMEVDHLLEGRTPAQRNVFKGMALSADKLVFQRGILTHVDRQRDDVCGPTIDTVILVHHVAEWLGNKSAADPPITAVEVGPGSGMVACLLAESPAISDLIAVDISETAARCTMKNLRINGATFDAVMPRIGVRAERFVAADFGKPVDLLICNPPYIPEFENVHVPDSSGYQGSVAGIQLSLEIFDSLSDVLSDGGRLLLMVSSVSAPEILDAMPAGYSAEPASADGYRVPLDVDTIWANDGWREALVQGGRVEIDEKGQLWHRLHPTWISKS